MQQEHQIPIWFFVGLLLTIYGMLIFGAGIYNWIYPPANVKLTGLHADVWWGILLLAIGLIYIGKFRPSKK